MNLSPGDGLFCLQKLQDCVGFWGKNLLDFNIN